MRLRNGSVRDLETCIFLRYFRRHVGDAHSYSSNKIVWEEEGKRFFSGQRSLWSTSVLRDELFGSALRQCLAFPGSVPARS